MKKFLLALAFTSMSAAYAEDIMLWNSGDYLKMIQMGVPGGYETSNLTCGSYTFLKPETVEKRYIKFTAIPGPGCSWTHISKFWHPKKAVAPIEMAIDCHSVYAHGTPAEQAHKRFCNLPPMAR